MRAAIEGGTELADANVARSLVDAQPDGKEGDRTESQERGQASGKQGHNRRVQHCGRRASVVAG